MGKVVLVTGANKGIGLAIVEALLLELPHSFLLLGSRDQARGQAAVDSLVTKLGSDYKERLKLVLLDVTSDSSVQTARETVEREHGRIHGLVNNAGGMAEGMSAREVIDLNLYGVRRVCEAFGPIIEEGGRIVQVSSGAASMFVQNCSQERKEFCVKQSVTWEEVESVLVQPFLSLLESCQEGEASAALEAAGFGPMTGMTQYGLSKAAVNCYTMELAGRFPGLTVSSCSPGFVETDLTRGFATKAGKTPAEMGMISVEEGARCPVYLMTADLSSLPGFSSGWYFGSDCKRSPLHKYRSPGSPAYEGEFP